MSVTAPPRRNFEPRTRGAGPLFTRWGNATAASFLGGIPACLCLSREETDDGAGNDAPDALAVRKQERHLTNFDLIRADRYPKGNNHLLLS